MMVRFGQTMWPFSERPRPPNLPPALMKELELFGMGGLLQRRSETGQNYSEVWLHGDKRIAGDQLDAFIAWKNADAAWRERRLYRTAWIGSVAAVFAAVLAGVAVCQNWKGGNAPPHEPIPPASTQIAPGNRP